jgi:hypothetical protein
MNTRGNPTDTDITRLVENEEIIAEMLHDRELPEALRKHLVVKALMEKSLGKKSAQ